MSDTENERQSIPTSGWDLQVIINKFDYSVYLNYVRIDSSIIAPYPIIELSFSLDPNIIIAKKIYGKDPISLTIRNLNSESTGVPYDIINMELVQIDDNSAALVRSMINLENSTASSGMSFLAIPKVCLQTISAFVNDVYIGKTPKEIIELMVRNHTGAKLDYDTSGENTEIIPQAVVPPMTLYNAIRYIDNNFGLFEGASNLGYCDHNNVLHIDNLTKRVREGTKYNIYHLAANSDASQDVLNRYRNDPNVFFSMSGISCKYSGNAMLANISNIMTYNLKPMDSLFFNKELNFKEVCNEYGIMSRIGADLFNTSAFDDLTVYRAHDVGGYGTESDTYIKAKLARALVTMSNISVQITPNPNITSLLKVGVSTKLTAHTLDTEELAGQYILKASDIRFSRVSSIQWNANSVVILSRTNKLN